MKTQEELNEINEEFDTLDKKLEELTEEDLRRVSGGTGSMNFPCPKCGGPGYICNNHYWCDEYKLCGYHHAVERTPDGQLKY